MKVTRKAYSKQLNKGKYKRLEEIAKRLGKIRKNVWQEYGSLKGVGLKDRQIRDTWLKEKRTFDVPARLWKEALRDTFTDIVTYREAAKVTVKKAIYKRTTDNQERKRFYTLLKREEWQKDSFLSRKMRKAYKHGKTSVNNQITLDSDCYTAFLRKGQAWIKVMSLKRGKRIAIPLNTNRLPTGTLRLILRDGKVEVHYAVDAELVCNTKPCGDGMIGLDKGYTEVFTDSDGDVHGDGLGDLLTKESDKQKVKNQRRNKLRALEKKHRKKGKHKKVDRIRKHNLGHKKRNKSKAKHKANVKDKIYKAVHSVIDKAQTIVIEDLTSPIKSKNYGKNQNRRLSGWVKGEIDKALNDVTKRRGSTLVYVNPAYTSQMDSRYGVLIGRRSGDKFHCFDGEVLQADENAAKNILARANDREITLYTPYQKVKAILNKRLGLLNLDTSYIPQGR